MARMMWRRYEGLNVDGAQSGWSRGTSNLFYRVRKIVARMAAPFRQHGSLTHIDTKLGTEQSKVIDNRTSLVSARFLAKFGSPPINYSTKDCFPFPVVHDLVESSGE
ncbi:hypothetical protein HZH66_002825 [Vespula vulgaris]|uniref:Uncharacterized protein n=1 Tax=Vespula vulgaris TaxID=7454 RepID=A0A834NI41_VESVU|nr:hypothetical protein HZH66_002825 [Vespula vulgaris]